MRIFQNINVDFLGKRKLYYLISGLLLLIGLISVAFRGLEFGIDFLGGTEIVINFEKPVDIGKVRSYVENIGLGNVEIKTFGGETGVLLRTELQESREIYPKLVSSISGAINKYYPGLPLKVADSSSTTSVVYEFPSSDTATGVVNILASQGFQASKSIDDATGKLVTVRVGIAEWIKQNLREKFPDNSFQVLREEKIGPKVGNELKRDAVVALFLSLLVILIYLAFRYKFIFGFGAVVAVFHDSLITLGLFSVLYGVIPGLNLEIDLTIVAAFLTLIGYSMSDTVVVFDRVRENMKIHKTDSLEQVINKSINQTMSRTILTGGTSLMCLLVLVFFGGEVLRAFSFTLFFGIIIGTYSSIFVASALVFEYAKRSKKKVQF
ncbi:MAG: protein translocase subunit SecF [Syntrophothermus sp.]|nr:protein translocase subunit SecF [Ignavibacteriaceae bacterium]